MKRTAACVVLMTYLTSICGIAHSQEKDNEKSVSSSACQPGVAAVVGGITGALFGGSKKNNKGIEGAVIGAAVGALACVAINYASKQTGTADDIRKQFESNSKGPLTSSQVVEYISSAQKPIVNKGEKEVIQSRIAVAVPSGQSIDIQEKIVLISPTGEKKSFVKKVGTCEGGSFENSFGIPIGQELPGGEWQYETTLLLDSKSAGVNRGKFTVS